MKAARRDDVEAVKAAMRAYGARLMVKCPACGAEVGARCRAIGTSGGWVMDAPHATRKAAETVA